MQQALVLAALAALASALPSSPYGGSPSKSLPAPSPTTCSSNQQNANFDDISVLPAVEVNPIPTPYKGLNFQGFDVTQALIVAGGTVQPGIPPHSGKNLAISDAVKTTTAGSAEWTTNYPGSNVQSFCLQSFYYGCATNLQQGAASLPAACNIAITGFRKGDNTAEAVQVASQEFSFNPSTTVGTANMVQGVFNQDFKDLQYVLIQYNLVGGQALLDDTLGLAIDDVKYTIKSN